MAELTVEQRRAVALARARQAQAQAQQAAPEAAPAPEAPDRSFMDRAGQFLAGGIEGMRPLLRANPFGSIVANDVMSSNAGETAEGFGEPADATDRRLRTAGEYVAPSAMFGLPGIASGLASGAAAGQVREMGGGAGMELIASMLAGGAPAMGMSAASKSVQARRAVNAVPSVDDLKATAGSLYDTGVATGQTASRGYTQQFANATKQIAADNGMVLPTGEVMTTSYPKVAAAMRMIDEYAGQKMTPEQMRQVRRVIQDAAQSADPAEARIGTKLVKQFDQFVDPLVPEFGEANRTYARAMRGEEIETATKIATEGRRSSPEVAISNEFQNLHRRGIRGDLTYPPELEAAVQHAANGSRTRQIAAGIGNLAPVPSNMVRAGLGLGSAATAGGTLGGPAGAAAATAGGVGAGLVARLLANNLAKNDALAASLVARNGGALPSPQTPEYVKAAIAALLAQQSSQAGQ